MNDPEPTTSPTRRKWWIAASVVLVLAIAGGGAWYAFGRDHQQSADAAMAARAQQVMPFDLNRTTHTFTKTADGGLQKVEVNDPTDTRDRDLIRAHLKAEVDSFRRGNYSDPAKIHGMNMPGVSELEQGAARVTVTYAENPNGAQITYTSTEPPLITALHEWFDRQASDHAMPGMGG
jgi:hypothetical protein